MDKNKALNILIEQNNTSAVKCSFFNINKYGYLNTSYFNFQNSIVSVDINSKYFNLSSGYRKRFSNIYKLAFGNSESLQFNILDEIDKETAYNDAFEIADILINNSDISNDNFTYNITDDVRDFLIMLILHVKCSDLKDKTLHGCLNCLFNFENDDDSDIIEFLDTVNDSPHCSVEIHEYISNNSKRFKNMKKDILNLIYHKALSLLNIFQNSNLRSISSQSDFCIKDFVMGKSKSLYITLPSSDAKIYYSYIRMIIIFFMNKIKKYYNYNIFKINSVLFLTDEFQKNISIPLNLYFNNIKYLSFRKNNYQDKINLPVISKRNNFLKECKSTLKPEKNSEMWYIIPEEMYMQSEETIVKPFFTSTVPDGEEYEEEYEEMYNIRTPIFNNDNEDEDERLKNLFKQTDRSSSGNKDIDNEKEKII